MGRVALDAGVVILLANRDARVAAARVAGHEFCIPVPVLAEVTRGNRRDATVNQVVKTIGAFPGLDEASCRHAGRLLGTTGLDATLDALIVSAAAAARSTVLLHHDLDDMPPLAAAAGIASWPIP